MKEEFKSLDLMFQRVDFKLNEFKSEKEKSFEQLEQYSPQINLLSVENELNVKRKKMIDKLKKIHDKSITEANTLIKQFRQQNASTDKLIELANELIQQLERIIQRQAKLIIDSSISPNVSHFLQLTFANKFSTVKLVKYLKLMPQFLHDFNYGNTSVMPITTTNNYLVINRSANILHYQNYTYNHWTFECYNKCAGLVQSIDFSNDNDAKTIEPTKELAETFSLANGGFSLAVSGQAEKSQSRTSEREL